MRRLTWLALPVVLAACSSDPPNSAKLTLRNMQWDHVNVQVIITRGANCDAPGADLVDTQDFALTRDQTRTIVAPAESSLCWRHDRYPTNPHPGEWSGWSRAILFPGNDTKTDV